MADRPPTDLRPAALATKAAKKTQALLREARSLLRRADRVVAASAGIPQPTSSPPRPKRLSSVSRIISSGWSDSTTAAPEKALVLESVNNADLSRPPKEASRSLLNVREVVGRWTILVRVVTSSGERARAGAPPDT
jgi:hypothetical protein